MIFVIRDDAYGRQGMLQHQCDGFEFSAGCGLYGSSEGSVDCLEDHWLAFLSLDYGFRFPFLAAVVAPHVISAPPDTSVPGVVRVGARTFAAHLVLLTDASGTHEQ